MPHATHKARRILTSDVPHAPVRRPRSRFEQQALLAVSVGLTMLVIVGLYAATFRSRMDMPTVDRPRWTLLDEDLLERAKPVTDQLADVKRSLQELAGAGKTQFKAAAILKAKIEARAAASGTPETPAPETPETP